MTKRAPKKTKVVRKIGKISAKKVALIKHTAIKSVSKLEDFIAELSDFGVDASRAERILESANDKLGTAKAAIDYDEVIALTKRGKKAAEFALRVWMEERIIGVQNKLESITSKLQEPGLIQDMITQAQAFVKTKDYHHFQEHIQKINTELLELEHQFDFHRSLLNETVNKVETIESQGIVVASISELVSNLRAAFNAFSFDEMENYAQEIRKKVEWIQEFYPRAGELINKAKQEYEALTVLYSYWLEMLYLAWFA